MEYARSGEKAIWIPIRQIAYCRCPRDVKSSHWWALQGARELAGLARSISELAGFGPTHRCGAARRAAFPLGADATAHRAAAASCPDLAPVIPYNAVALSPR